MILAFPAHRRGIFKATGPVIDEALRRGHDVHLIHRDDDKAGEGVTRDEIEARWPTSRINVNAWPSVLPPLDAMLGPSLHAMPWLPKARRRYVLDLAWENVTTPVGHRLHHCWASDHQRDLWVTANGGGPHGLIPAIWDHSVTGSPMFDAFYGEEPRPQARPYLLLMALKFPRDSGVWRRYWYRWSGYVALVHALQRYCRAMGWDLVIKTREKNRDPWWLAGLADRVVLDRDLWPYTSVRWVRHAALVVHFQSGAALEAAVAGVPQVSVHLPHPHLAHYPAHREVYWSSPGMQDWPGVVLGLGWETAIGVIDEINPWRVNDAERATYVAKFLGFDDGRTASRILDLVEGQR